VGGVSRGAYKSLTGHGSCRILSLHCAKKAIEDESLYSLAGLQKAMARCDSCGTTILFGGVTEGNLRFCNATCYQRGFLLTMANEVPENLVSQHLAALHQGPCPKCNGPGPVDVHTSHVVWSLLVMTSWNSIPQVCCRRCGVKSKLGNALISGLVGWWGFPWGLIMTPIQIVRNTYGVFSPPDPTQPSTQLEQLVRVNLAAQLIAVSDQQQANA
jgi:hypothetical protein